MDTETASPQVKDIARRIQAWYGGELGWWEQAVLAYAEACPIYYNASDDDTAQWEFDGEFDDEPAVDGAIIVDLWDAGTGLPVTASELIEDFRLWDFLAAEFTPPADA